ncbi:hypothetical protein R3P38DRAFT_3191382 [Favolaschia claudopus]|uniref:Transposase n=1 Tax=Favolaschia claudopus TaxID=2862362 RepID=A0AAW0BJQ3_9AGAR
MMRGNKKDISDDKRESVVHLHYFCGHKQADVAHELGISLRSVQSILCQHRRAALGNPTPPTYRVRGRPRILQVTDVDFLVALVQRTPDIYLYEMQTELREEALESRLFFIFGLLNVFTQVSRVAVQRDEEARTQFEIYMTQNYNADQLVFVDEAARNRNASKRGWWLD